MVGTSSGPEVFAQLRQAATAARREAEAAEQAAAYERDRATALDRDRLQTLRELAATQLPQLDGATAAAAMPELVDELQAFERQRQERAAALAREIAQLEAAMAERSSGLAAATRELDAAVARRDTLLQQVAAELARDPAYEPLSAQATQAEVRLARDVARADELRAEAKAKLGPYESSRLFQYLWRRRFGTAEYRSRGFAARMDRRVAELIGFARAADSYRFLTTTPRLVALEVERRTEEVRGLRARLEAMEDAVEQRLGVPPVQAEVDRMVAERERAVAAIDALQKRIAAAHTAVRDEAGGRGTFHAQALQRLTTFLARAEAGALERHARSTPDPRDDQLVAALRAITQQLADVQRRAGPLDDEARQRDAVADGLEDLLVRFRREDFDAGRSEFDGLDLTGLLVDVRRGSRPVSALWDALRSRQRFRRPPAVHHANRSHGVLDGVGLALQIGSVLAGAGRGARQRGGFSTGGGFGGGRCGGFSTGGGFGGGKGGFTTGESF